MLLADLPVRRLVELAKRAEDGGFTYFWLNDCDILFENPWPIFALIADNTERIKIGPLVTNPVTRDLTVTAGLFATLNEISGGRMVCGAGRGDVTVRILGKKPSTLSQFERFIGAVRDLVAGREVRYGESPLRIEWSSGRKLEMWGAGYGPKVLKIVGRTCDGLVIQAGDPAMIRWTTELMRAGAERSGRKPQEVKVMVGAPAYVTDDADHGHDQTRWFGGVVANHVAELAEHYGDRVPAELREILEGRDSYEFAVKGASGHEAASYISNAINQRFSIVGDTDYHTERIQEFADLDVHSFSLYLNHDGLDQTLETYSTDVIPRFNP
jgi:probable F420-dependent oxidoreductase